MNKILLCSYNFSFCCEQVLEIFIGNNEAYTCLSHCLKKTGLLSILVVMQQQCNTGVSQTESGLLLMNKKYQCALIFAEHREGQVKQHLEFISKDFPEPTTWLSLSEHVCVVKCPDHLLSLWH